MQASSGPDKQATESGAIWSIGRYVLSEGEGIPPDTAGVPCARTYIVDIGVTIDAAPYLQWLLFAVL